MELVMVTGAVPRLDLSFGRPAAAASFRMVRRERPAIPSQAIHDMLYHGQDQQVQVDRWT